MKNIIIFGDSYGDPEYFTSNSKFKYTHTWYEMLKTNYNVINHSVHGSGPHYSFKKYYEFISKEKELSNYICIFLLSGQDRIHFFSRKPDSGTHISWSNTDQKSYLINDKDKSFYNNYNSEIDFLYLTMQEEIEWSNYKNVSFLYVNSILLDLKTFVFFTSTNSLLSNSEETSIKRARPQFNYGKLNNFNFFVYNTLLSRVSEQEFSDLEKIMNQKKYIHYAYKDYRRNHFSQENHEVFYSNIQKLIDNDHRYLTPFKKHLNPSSYYGEVIFDEHIKNDKFIYD